MQIAGVPAELEPAGKKRPRGPAEGEEENKDAVRAAVLHYTLTELDQELFMELMATIGRTTGCRVNEDEVGAGPERSVRGGER